MIHTLTLNPSFDKTAECKEISIGGLNRIEIISKDTGGKGINVSKTVRALNGTSIAYALLGGAIGDAFKHSFEEMNIPLKFSEIEETTRTNLKVIDGKGKLTEFNEIGPAVSKKNVKEILSVLKQNVKPLDVVVISGSLPQGIDQDIYKKIVLDMKKLGALVILDVSGEPLKLAISSKPTIIKPNRYELATLYDVDTLSIDECVEKAKDLVKQGIVLAVVSLGKEGALYVTKEESYHVLPIHVEKNSTVGAGDALVAGLAYAYDQKYTLDEMIKISTAAATGAITTKGTNPADANLVKRYIKAVIIKKK